MTFLHSRNTFHSLSVRPCPTWLSLSSQQTPLFAQKRQARGRRRASAPRKSSAASLSFLLTHIHFRDASHSSLPGSLQPSLHQKAFFSPEGLPLHRTPPTSTSDKPLRQVPFLRKRDEESRLTSLQKEKADLTEAPNRQSLALSSIQKALEEKTFAQKATVSAFGTLERQFSDLNNEKSSLSNPNQELLQKDRSVPYNYTNKKPYCLSAVVSLGMLDIS